MLWCFLSSTNKKNVSDVSLDTVKISDKNGKMEIIKIENQKTSNLLGESSGSKSVTKKCNIINV